MVAPANRVTRGEERDGWRLTMGEQAAPLKILMEPAMCTPRMAAGRKKAERLFGTATLDCD